MFQSMCINGDDEVVVLVMIGGGNVQLEKFGADHDESGDLVHEHVDFHLLEMIFLKLFGFDIQQVVVIDFLPKNNVEYVSENRDSQVTFQLYSNVEFFVLEP